jgi:type III restriction enzyme
MEAFVASGKIQITPPLFNQEDLRRRLVVTLNLSKIVQHLWESIIAENTESLAPIFDTERPIVSTGDMRTWYTGKPSEFTKRSHVNFCVFDSTWEATEAFELDRNKNVDAWVKNDHLGFEVLYVYKGVVHKYRPDFIIRLNNGRILILETKGQDTDQDKTKRVFLDEWVTAVNEHGGFGKWCWAVSQQPGDAVGILKETSLR